MANQTSIKELSDHIRHLEQEIAASRRALSDLQREQLFSEKVLDSLPGIVYLYNQNGQIIRWNKNHETLTDFTAEELPRRHIFDWFSGADKERVVAVVDKIRNRVGLFQPLFDYHKFFERISRSKRGSWTP